MVTTLDILIRGRAQLMLLFLMLLFLRTALQDVSGLEIASVGQTCRSGGSVRFGVPWPTAIGGNPLKEISATFDEDSEEFVVMKGNTKSSADATGLFQNFVRESQAVSSERSDGEVNSATCPAGMVISFGFSLQFTTDESSDVRDCVKKNNRACERGSIKCETKERCVGLEKKSVKSMVWIICENEHLSWPKNGLRSISRVGDGGAASLSCDKTEGILFGFGVHWSAHPRTKRMQACMMRNNKRCTVGDQNCQQELCRSTGKRDKDVSFLYMVCARKEDIPYDESSAVSLTGDAKSEASISCPGKKLMFGFALQHSNDWSDVPANANVNRFLCPIMPGVASSTEDCQYFRPGLPSKNERPLGRWPTHCSAAGTSLLDQRTRPAT